MIPKTSEWPKLSAANTRESQVRGAPQHCTRGLPLAASTAQRAQSRLARRCSKLNCALCVSVVSSTEFWYHTFRKCILLSGVPLAFFKAFILHSRYTKAQLNDAKVLFTHCITFYVYLDLKQAQNQINIIVLVTYLLSKIYSCLFNSFI